MRFVEYHIPSFIRRDQPPLLMLATKPKRAICEPASPHHVLVEPILGLLLGQTSLSSFHVKSLFNFLTDLVSWKQLVLALQ